MSPDLAISILKQALLSGAVMMAPVLAVGLSVGITVGALQAATQVNEPTLTFVPKVLCVGTVGALLLPWALDRLISIVHLVMTHAAQMGGGG